MAQEMLQVSSSLNPGICWVSVCRNGPLLFSPHVLGEGGFYPLSSNIKQDGSDRLFSSWKPPGKVLWHRLAPNQAGQHLGRRVRSSEIIIQWLPQKAAPVRSSCARARSCRTESALSGSFDFCWQFLVPVRKTKWTPTLPKLLIWEMKSRSAVWVRKAMLRFFQTLLSCLEKIIFSNLLQPTCNCGCYPRYVWSGILEGLFSWSQCGRKSSFRLVDMQKKPPKNISDVLWSIWYTQGWSHLTLLD